MRGSFAREYRIVLTGARRAGKSCLAFEFFQPYYLLEYDPTGDEGFRKQIVVDDEIAIIDVLDMENREEFRAPAMKEQYIKTGDGFLLVYAIDSLESLDEVRTVYQEISAVKAGCGFPVVLLGSKCDLEEKRVVSIDGGKALALEFGCPHLEVSAVTKHNLDEAMDEMVREVRRYNEARAALNNQAVVPKLQVLGDDRKEKDERRGHRCCLTM